MATKHETWQALKDTGVVAVIRADSSGDLIDVGRALRQGGVKFIEITMTVPDALQAIEAATAALRNDDAFFGGTGAAAHAHRHHPES